MKEKRQKNIYKHDIDLKDLSIKNMPREHFREELEKIKYRGYKVEEISDGRFVVITKPGGKFTFGKIRREDFMEWIYNPTDSTLWLISHKDIWNDLEQKGNVNKEATLEIINALEKVFNGEEPDEVLKNLKTQEELPGEKAEVLLKAYKWIWGQEDCNYPDGQGRDMSMREIQKLKEKLKRG